MVLDRLFSVGRTMLCGMSSWLVQVTSAPALICSTAGEKVKLSIVTAPASSAWAPPNTASPAAPSAERSTLRRTQRSGSNTSFMEPPSAGQWGIDDRERGVARDQADLRDAQVVPQFTRRNGHGSRPLGLARLRLGKGR